MAPLSSRLTNKRSTNSLSRATSKETLRETSSKGSSRSGSSFDEEIEGNPLMIELKRAICEMAVRRVAGSSGSVPEPPAKMAFRLTMASKETTASLRTASALRNRGGAFSQASKKFFDSAFASVCWRETIGDERIPTASAAFE